MAYEFIKTENRDGIVIVTIDNEKNLNALNVKILKEIYNVFDELNEDKSVDVVILTGTGRAFVAGADIAEMAPLNGPEGAIFGQIGSKSFRRIETLRYPVIAAVNGFALGRLKFQQLYLNLQL